MLTIHLAVLPKWMCAGLGIICSRGSGSIPGVVSYWVWDGGQWCDSVRSARVVPALNGYLEKFGEGKQEGCAKAQDGLPPSSHCTFWLNYHETEMSTAGLALKGLVTYRLTYTYR